MSEQTVSEQTEASPDFNWVLAGHFYGRLAEVIDRACVGCHLVADSARKAYGLDVPGLYLAEVSNEENVAVLRGKGMDLDEAIAAMGQFVLAANIHGLSLVTSSAVVIDSRQSVITAALALAGVEERAAAKREKSE